MQKKLKHLVAAALAAVLLPLALSEPAHACSCLESSPPLEALEGSTAVFLGLVVDVRDYRIEKGVKISTSHPFYEFRVERIWKGPVAETVFVASSFGTCSFRFDVGRRYVVYAYGDPSDLRTSLCGRTARVANAAEDLRVLGDWQLPEPQTSMSTPTLAPTTEPEPTSTPELDTPGGMSCGTAATGVAAVWPLTLITGLAFRVMTMRRN